MIKIKLVVLNKKIAKKLLLILFLLLLVALVTNISMGQITKQRQDSTECEKYMNYILAFMNPYINEELENYFGYHKNFDLFQIEIVDIIDGTYQGYYFDIILLVTSYQGAHLYDFSQNELTFRLDSTGLNLINFE